MKISIRFKDKNKVFRGRTYDYLLAKDEEVPKVGDIIRLLDNDYNYLHYGTRTRVENVSAAKEEDKGLLTKVRLIQSSLDE